MFYRESELFTERRMRFLAGYSACFQSTDKNNVIASWIVWGGLPCPFGQQRHV